LQGFEAMAIFGRSKKSSQTTSLRSKPSTNFYQHPNYQAYDGTETSSNWAYVDQTSNTSQVYGQPQGWLLTPIPHHYQPVLVPQNYLTPPPLPRRPENHSGNISKLNLCSVTNLLANDIHDSGTRFIHNEVTPLYLQGTQYLTQGAALCDLISSKLNNVITLIDGERFSGDERELAVFAPPPPMLQQQQETGITEQGVRSGKSKGMVNNSVSSALTSTNYFAKVHLYANSRLPPNFPPMKL